MQSNFLSTELRIPVTLLETQACSPLATNAIRDNIWDNFSSESYKGLPSVGTVTLHHPLTGEVREQYEMPGGGLGYTRPASLISVWATAPYLLNNSLGYLNPKDPRITEDGFEYSPYPTVEERLESFEDGIRKLLWLETRRGNISYQTASGKMVPGWVDLTDETSYLRVPKGFLPDWLQKPGLMGKLSGHLSDIKGKDKEEGIELGPIPKGTPVNIIVGLDLDKREGIDKLKHKRQLVELLIKVKKRLLPLGKNPTDDEVKTALRDVVDDLVEANKCRDYIVNRGHYFGTDFFAQEPGLSDREKNALIAFLKTL